MANEIIVFGLSANVSLNEIILKFNNYKDLVKITRIFNDGSKKNIKGYQNYIFVAFKKTPLRERIIENWIHSHELEEFFTIGSTDKKGKSKLRIDKAKSEKHYSSSGKALLISNVDLSVSLEDISNFFNSNNELIEIELMMDEEQNFSGEVSLTFVRSEVSMKSIKGWTDALPPFLGENAVITNKRKRVSEISDETHNSKYAHRELTALHGCVGYQHQDNSQAVQEQYQFVVPKSKCGIIIGRSGVTIKEINFKSGAHCEIYRENAGKQTMEKTNEKIFTIKGEKHQIDEAKRLIQDKINMNIMLTPIGTQIEPLLNFISEAQNAQNNSQSWGGSFAAVGYQGQQVQMSAQAHGAHCETDRTISSLQIVEATFTVKAELFKVDEVKRHIQEKINTMSNITFTQTVSQHANNYLGSLVHNAQNPHHLSRLAAIVNHGSFNQQQHIQVGARASELKDQSQPGSNFQRNQYFWATEQELDAELNEVNAQIQASREQASNQLAQSEFRTSDRTPHFEKST